MITRASRLALLSALLLPAAASAQAPVPAPAPAPVPATGHLTVIPERVGAGHETLVGSRIRVRAVVTPYVAGQTVTVRVYQFGRKVLVKQRPLVRSASGRSGMALLGYVPKAVGALEIRASHVQTAGLATLVAAPASVTVLPRQVRQGATGRAVRMMQSRLKALHYVVGQAGVYDDRTARAVLAFRKLAGMDRIISADESFFRAMLRGAGVFKVRYPAHGRHVEADLTHQVLALIGAGGAVERIYPISSGKPSTPTILGTFRVYMQQLGVNAKGMVDSSFFHNGYAIHGYAEVPVYPASHGCLRTPVPDARSIHDWLKVGTTVDVYYR